jgi:hypothetical protein
MELARGDRLKFHHLGGLLAFYCTAPDSALEIFSDQQALFVHEWPLDPFECPFFVSPQAEMRQAASSLDYDGWASMLSALIEAIPEKRVVHTLDYNVAFFMFRSQSIAFEGSRTVSM